ncbi:MAG TPA: asparaginase [Candidatus Acidoferrum sp.]|nr:asparaginase [Candidatus Acidoferrum sp.]
MNTPAISTPPVGAEVAARVYRGAVQEAIHYASIAVVDRTGRLTHYLGDPDIIMMTRSSIKPFQLTPLVMTGAADHFKFTNEQLAIMAGSHSGTEDHVRVILSNLAQAGNKAEHLKCGCHVPIWMQNDGVFPRAGEEKDPTRHNCSGKHTNFLALARFMGVEPGHYLDPESNSQRLVKKIISEVCEYPEEKMKVGVDGCSAPNFPLPLRNLAVGYSKLARPFRCAQQIGSALDRIRTAMSEFPVMVSGEKRLDMVIMQSFPGRAISKGGGEAIQGIGFVEPHIGIAIKVHDGSFRPLGAICLEIFRQLGLVAKIEDFPYLMQYDRPEVRNNSDLVTGHVVTEFELKKA